MPEFKKNTSPAMKRSGFKMNGYSYPGASPAKKVTIKAKEGSKDWMDLYNRAKDDNASQATLDKLLSKAKAQKSAGKYVRENPNANRVIPYATGEKTINKKTEGEA